VTAAVSALASTAQRFAGLLGRAPAAAPAVSSLPPPYAVRVLAGMHRGATLRLRNPARLGSSDDNDVVLRDPDVLAHHAELRCVHGVWGFYELAKETPGSAATPESQARLIPPFETARHGRFVRRRHALGAAQLVITQAVPLPAPLSGPLQRVSRLLTPVVLVLAALLGAAGIVQLVTPASANLVTGTRSLASEGWADVQLVNEPNKPLLVRGYVDNAGSLDRLKRWLADENLSHGVFAVRDGAELAARVRDAVGDADLTVSYQPGGSVRVQGTSSKMAARERLRRITADLAGAVRVDDRVAFVEAPDRTPKQHVLPIRIVDVRPGTGEHGGSFGSENSVRFFVGAVLSDGSEVLAIGDDSIEFSMNGRRINYPLK
jgi:hypothetical protein